MDSEARPAEAKESLERVGEAAVVIGLGASGGQEAVRRAIRWASDAVRPLVDEGKALILHSDAAIPDGGCVGEEDRVRLVALPLPEVDRLAGIGQGAGDPWRALFDVCRKVGGKACALIGSELESIGGESIQGLIQPLLEGSCDLAVPYYRQQKLDGLINSGIVYPLTRALYGKRIRYPLTTDIGASAKFIERFSKPEQKNGRMAPLAWLPVRAVCAGMPVRQVRVDLRPPPAKGKPDLSSTLSLVLDSLFLEMDRNAAVWQKVRGSQAVVTQGETKAEAEESAAVDVHKMVESFQMGYRNLVDVWGMALTPATMLELKKLTRLPEEQFRMPDEVWVRVVYDFALGHRFRVMSRDHLLRAMTPAYLAWVASYILEVRDAGPRTVDDRLERLCLSYEANKPYLLSRWRWPDRFNP
ncbi:MAG: hypothetical protein IT165_22120 [Bryobacterales bacterium]|nr:hypothetical protein [Bryobacterales bacterium]